MKYTVIWAPTAEAELIRLWTDSHQRAQITEAVDAIDAALARDPFQVGESRPDDRRIVIQLPVVVVCRIYPEDRRVDVTGIWLPKHK